MSIRRQDALLDGEGETEWPEVDFIVGNPPFLGNYKMRQEFGDTYTEAVYQTFTGRLPNKADFVCYWFEKARAHIADGKAERAGLIATNSIRGGANRKVLERIKDSGGIFLAYSNEPWILEGAAVRVSMVGFDDGSEVAKVLDGQPAAIINADLTGSTDVNQAKKLPENADITFEGIKPAGDFVISDEVAQAWLRSPNPNGRSNADVLKPYINGRDLAQRPRRAWLIDFYPKSLQEASEYLLPFSHVEENVKPARLSNRDKFSKDFWWLHQRPRPDIRQALEPLTRYIAVTRHSKHLVFVWLGKETLPDSALVVVSKDDDLTYGLLNSSLHKAWANSLGTWLGVGNNLRYTPSTCFETFPFPYPTNAQRADIEKWAAYLNTVRSQLLKDDPSHTMTKLYNDVTDLRATRDSKHPAYSLLLAHERLDAAVAAAYGWEWPMTDDAILAALLALNLERSTVKAA